MNKVAKGLIAAALMTIGPIATAQTLLAEIGVSQGYDANNGAPITGGSPFISLGNAFGPNLPTCIGCSLDVTGGTGLASNLVGTLYFTGSTPNFSTFTQGLTNPSGIIFIGEALTSPSEGTLTSATGNNISTVFALPNSVGTIDDIQLYYSFSLSQSGSGFSSHDDIVASIYGTPGKNFTSPYISSVAEVEAFIAPEIDLTSAITGLTLLAGGLAVLRGRRGKKQ
jgi:hypothetical protein